MPVSLEQFIKQIKESGIVSQETLKELISPKASPKDAAELALALVRQKKLTKFQAEEISRGKGKSLTLGNYLVLDKLGQGGMGLVLKASHKRMKRLVAIKVMSPAVTNTAEALKRFHREVEAAAKLEHPNIVAAYDADEANGTHFFVMQFVAGQDLSSLVKSKGPLPVARAVNYVLQAARGLEYAHQRGVVHRDIKPANLLVDESGTVKVLDMGLARIEGETGAQTELTSTGTVMGTVDFMAPEQALSTKHADARSDIYSLGISLWYLLTGRCAYDGDTLMAKLLAHREAPIPSLCSQRSDVSAALDTVFRKMLAKQVADRYQTMTEVIRDLQACGIGNAPAGDTVGASGSRESQTLLHSSPGQAETMTRTRSSPGQPAVAERAAAPTSAEATMLTGDPGQATDPETLTRLGQVADLHAAARKTRRPLSKPPMWTDRRVQIGSGLAAAAVLLVVILKVQLIDDKRVATSGQVPGDNATSKPTAEVVLKPEQAPKPDWHGWPADAPQPAVAPFEAAQAKKHQAGWAAYLKAPVEHINSIGMKFVLIPPGEFLMGSTEAEIEDAVKDVLSFKAVQDGIRSEAPPHKVILTQPFYLGVYEVTQAEYEQVMGTNPSEFSQLGKSKDLVAGLDTKRHPVELVTWNDAADFCLKLGQNENLNPCYDHVGEAVTPRKGTGYRLPHEAEWEYACRAGTTTSYWNGDKAEDLPQVAWVGSNAGKRTHPVGELKANPFGLYDIHGNVWEWVEDAFDQEYYGGFRVTPAINPLNPYTASSRHVIRGGHWVDVPSFCRSAVRHCYAVPWRLSSTGFRVAMSVDGVREARKQPVDTGSQRLKAPVTAVEPDPARVSPAGQLPADSRLGKLRDINSHSPFSPPATLDSWKARREQLRKQVLVATGLWPMPDKLPLRPVIHGRLDRGDYTIEKVYFATLPGFYLCGNLYRPKGKPGKLPAVLAPHGHEPQGRFAEHDDQQVAQALQQGSEADPKAARYPLQARAAPLARLGCVVFQYDMVGFADTKQLEHRVGFTDAEAELRLQSTMGLQTWNSLRALDFVANLPDVDPTRIGVTGSSGGGTQTFMLCAIDDRPAAAFPAVMVSTAMQGGCVCENCSLLRLDTGNIEIAALFAPKPLGLSGANDWTREIETKGYPELQALYRLYGTEDHVLARCFPQFEHGYNLPSRKLMYEWFNRWLKLGLAEPIEEPAFEPVPPAELSVFDDGHPLPADAVDAQGLHRSLTQAAEQQLADLLPRDTASLAKFREAIGETLAVMVHDHWPLSEKVEVQQTNEAPLAEMPSTKLRKLLLRRQHFDEQVPAVLLVPDRASGTVVVWLHAAGKSSLFERGRPSAACRRLLDRQMTILAPDVFLTGEFEPAPRPPVDEHFAGFTFGYNRTVLANRVHDTLSALDYGLSLPGTKQVHLVGFGRAGIWALIARALAGESLGHTATDLNYFAFEQVKSTGDDMLLPGALKYGGLPAIAALCAPGKLSVYGAPDGFDAWPTAAYRSAGAFERLKLSRDDASEEAMIDWLLSDS